MISIVPKIMSNLDRLKSQVNLKDVSVAQITQALSGNHNALIKLVVVVIALVLAGGMFNDYHKRDQEVRAQMAQVQQKLDAIKSRDAAIGNFNDFKSSLSKDLNETDLITLISNYAKSYRVTIASLSPAQSKDMGIYDLINLNFDAVSENFRIMMMFLRKIETSEYPLRINTWSGNETDDGKMTFRIEISAVIIHP